MNRKIVFRTLGAVVALGVVGYVGAWSATALFGNKVGDPTAKLDEDVTPAILEQGAYVARLSDCAACHTAPGGKPFAGGLPLASPIGTIYSSNITPDKTTGIGRYSYGDFERAVRHGVRPDGTTLYPAMPYPSYARLTDADTKALYAWLMHDVTPVAQKTRPTGIPWPLSMRWPLTYWRWIFAPGTVATPDMQVSDAELARGAYLVEGPGHCGSCHTPRGVGLELKALTKADGRDFLSGGVVDNYVANNLRGDPVTGLGGWSEDDIVQFLKTGHNTHSAVFGGMSDVVVNSTQHMTDADLKAIAQFLKSLPADKGETAFAFDNAQAVKLGNLDVSKPGALDYMNSCAACHLSSGKGYDKTFPALAGNPAVVAEDPISVIHIILSGSTRPATMGAPTNFAMPGFADRLTDDEVAAITNFLRTSWGNHASQVTAQYVAKIRKTIDAPTPDRLRDPTASAAETQ